MVLPSPSPRWLTSDVGVWPPLSQLPHHKDQATEKRAMRREYQKVGAFRPHIGEYLPTAAPPAGCQTIQAATRIQMPAPAQFCNPPPLVGTPLRAQGRTVPCRGLPRPVTHRTRAGSHPTLPPVHDPIAAPLQKTGKIPRRWKAPPKTGHVSRSLWKCTTTSIAF